MISHFFLGAAFLAGFLPPFLPPFLAAVFFTFLEAAFLAILGAGAAAAATLRATEND